MSDSAIWTLILIALWIVGMVIFVDCKYDQCRKAGFNHDQCVDSVACNG